MKKFLHHPLLGTVLILLCATCFAVSDEQAAEGRADANWDPGDYAVGVCYHAYGSDFFNQSFLGQYDNPSVRSTVREQLQEMADNGASVIKTSLWLVRESTDDETCPGCWWEFRFPPSATESANLRQFAQDVASINASDGHRLKMYIAIHPLWCSSYSENGDSTLGDCHLSTSQYSSRMMDSFRAIINNVSDIRGGDSLPVVKIIYMDFEVAIGTKDNEDWYLSTFYPTFESMCEAEGIEPSVYFHVLEDGSAGRLYDSLYYMLNNGLTIPDRIDFSYYASSGGVSGGLNNVESVLSSLGISRDYAVVEMYHSADAYTRLRLGQEFSGEYMSSGNPKEIMFWTTPNGGGTDVDIGFPFDVHSYEVGSYGTVLSNQSRFVLQPGQIGTAQISWATLYGTDSQVYVSVNGSGETLFSQGPSGSESAAWIIAPNTYTFTLYEGLGHSDELGGTVVVAGFTTTTTTTSTTSTTTTSTTSTSTTTTQAVFLSVSLNEPADQAAGPENNTFNATVVGSSLYYLCNISFNGIPESTREVYNNSKASFHVSGLGEGSWLWGVTCWNDSSQNHSETRNYTVTTSTTLGECDMECNTPPCDVITASEVVDAINLWLNEELDLINVLGLISSWLDPSSHPPS